MKIFKRKLFWLSLVILLVLIGFGGYFLFGKKEKTEYTTEPVRKGNLTQTVSATGAVESAQETTLNFRNTGKLIFLNATEGQKVKAGDILAKIDAASLSADLKNANGNLLAARATLEKVLAGASSEDIKVSEEQLAKAESDLASLLTDSAEQTKTLREKNLDALKNSVAQSQVILNKIDNYFFNTNLTTELTVSDSNLFNQVKNQFQALEADFSSIELVAASVGDTNQGVLDASVSVRDFLIKLNDLLSKTFKLSEAIITNISYSQTTKDAIKADISLQQTNNNNNLSALQTARTNLSNGLNSYQSQIQSAQNTVSIYQAQLNLKKAGPKSYDLKSAQATVVQAQAQYDKIIAMLDDYVIKAPIDGVITAVNNKLGEQVNMSKGTTLGLEPTIRMIGTEKFQIKVDIPESDVTKIKLGSQAVITLDAFGSDHIFSGAVSFVDPAQTVIQDVIYYKTTISLNADEWNERIKPGMTADVTINTDKKENILYIPQRAVKVKEAALGEVAEKFVQVLVDGKPQEKIITVGMRGDNGLVEILSGLNEGDMVITFVKEPKK